MSIRRQRALHACGERQDSRFKYVDFSIERAAGQEKTRAALRAEIIFLVAAYRTCCIAARRSKLFGIANIKVARAAFSSRAFAQISRSRYDVARHTGRTDVTL
jgi:hypothetical protein